MVRHHIRARELPFAPWTNSHNLLLMHLVNVTSEIILVYEFRTLVPGAFYFGAFYFDLCLANLRNRTKLLGSGLTHGIGRAIDIEQ